MKQYLDEVELQSSKLNLELRRTAMIDCDRYPLQQGRFRKVRSGFQSFLAKSCIQFQILLVSRQCHVWMEISVIQGNEKIPFWSHVTKP